MSANSKIALAVAGGYLLGRTKKLRLAVSLAGLMAGRKLATNRQLLSQGSRLIESNPHLKELQGQLTGRLMDVAKEAAMVAAAGRVESLTRTLQVKDADDEPDEPEDEAPEDEAPDDEPDDEPDEAEDEPDDEDEDEEPAAKRPAKKAAAKKTATKKTSARRPRTSKTSASTSSRRRTAKKSASSGSRG